jgi:oligosaccharide translocation protein RFT1
VEPLYILSSARLLFGLRGGIEAAATLAKGVTVLALVRGGGSPVLAFSWAQLAYAGVVVGGYAAWFAGRGSALLRGDSTSSGSAATEGRGADGKAGSEMAPPAAKSRRSSSEVSETSRVQGSVAAGGKPGEERANRAVSDWRPDVLTLQLAGSFSLQAAGKLVLAEGGKVVLSTLQGGKGQGVYGLVNNLGSLVVRTLFQPFEEAAFAAFSKVGAEGGLYVG